MNVATRQDRIEVLDGVRGIAILMVLMVHSVQDLKPSGALAQLWRWVWMTGWSGVDLFFVLSGFLITGILLKSRGNATYYKNFYASRFFRIFPLYYGMLAVVMFIIPRLDPEFQNTYTYNNQLPLWTYTTNWTIAKLGHWAYDTHNVAMSHFWSLAVEEQFYIIWPVFVSVLGARGVRITALGMMAYAIITRTMIQHQSVHYNYFSTLSHWDGLAAGSFLATVTSLKAPRVSYSKLVAVLSVLTLGVAQVVIRYPASMAHRSIGFTLLAIGFSLGAYSLLAFQYVKAVSKTFGWAPLRVLGKYSYAVYLLHPMVVAQLNRNIWRANLGNGMTMMLVHEAALLAGCVALGWASFNLFERHFMSMKDRLLNQGA